MARSVFTITTLKLEIEGEFLNLIMLIFERPVVNIIQIGDQKFPHCLGMRKRKELLTLTILCNIVLAVLANARREEEKKNKRKERNRERGRKERIKIQKQYMCVHLCVRKRETEAFICRKS